MLKVKLTESTDARNARMWARPAAAEDAFTAHLILLEWVEGVKGSKARMRAWLDGPEGLGQLAMQGVPGYGQLIWDRYMEDWR